jgi:hypothetical protein
LRPFEDELLRPFVEVFPRVGAALRAGFLAADFLAALRGRAAVEARFLVLLLALFDFRGFSVLPATASLNALAALVINQSRKESCAKFCASGSTSGRRITK